MSVFQIFNGRHRSKKSPEPQPRRSYKPLDIFSSISNRVIIGLPLKFIPHVSALDFRQVTVLIITSKETEEDTALLETIFEPIPATLTQIDYHTYLLRFAPTWKVLEAVSLLDLVATELTKHGKTVEKRLGYPGDYAPQYPSDFYALDKPNNYTVVPSFTSAFLNEYPSFKNDAIHNPFSSLAFKDT